MDKWRGITPNEPVTLDEFMAKYCEQRSKRSRRYRQKALGAGTDPLQESADIDAGSIRCQGWLGGLLSHYYRQAG